MSGNKKMLPDLQACVNCIGISLGRAQHSQTSRSLPCAGRDL